MRLFFCSWWETNRACGALAEETIIQSGMPDRHVCLEHFKMWRMFKEAV